MQQIDSPIGFVLAQTAKRTSRNFEACLVTAGGSLSTWLVLLALSEKGWMPQSDLAAFVGVQGSTLTHHLNGMEQTGLITRTRLPIDRRAHKVQVTAQGRSLFAQLRTTALHYDAKLRGAISSDEMTLLRDLLNRLANASGP
jgi:MarR family transcriptional regulator, transcriptional regulator for hemolysin